MAIVGTRINTIREAFCRWLSLLTSARSHGWLLSGFVAIDGLGIAPRLVFVRLAVRTSSRAHLLSASVSLSKLDGRLRRRRLSGADAGPLIHAAPYNEGICYKLWPDSHIPSGSLYLSPPHSSNEKAAACFSQCERQKPDTYARSIFNASSKQLVFSSVNPRCLRWPRAESMRLLLRSLSRANTRLRIRGEPDDFSASSHTKTKLSRIRRITVCPNNSIEKFTLFTWNGSKANVCSSTRCF